LANLKLYQNISRAQSEKHKEIQKIQYDKGKTPRSYVLGDLVSVRALGKGRKFTEPLFTGPAEVIKVLDRNNYIVWNTQRSKTETVNVENLRSWSVSSSPQQKHQFQETTESTQSLQQQNQPLPVPTNIPEPQFIPAQPIEIPQSKPVDVPQSKPIETKSPPTTPAKPVVAKSGRAIGRRETKELCDSSKQWLDRKKNK
jgi:hypothetical protein